MAAKQPNASPRYQIDFVVFALAIVARIVAARKANAMACLRLSLGEPQQGEDCAHVQYAEGYWTVRLVEWLALARPVDEAT